jgi:ribonuclease HI
MYRPDSVSRELPGDSKTPEQYLIANSDGGARGNPGPAGYGVVIRDQSGRRIAALSQYLGHQTNNFAEYQGLIAALEYAVTQGHKSLKVLSDSELLVRQIKGIYKVKNPGLQDLHARAKDLIGKLTWFNIDHVLRGRNQEADQLANAAMDQGMGRGNLREAAIPANAAPDPAVPQEYEGIVRDGKIELLNGTLPDQTRVQVRIRR